MLIELFAAVLSLVFSIMMLLKFKNSKDIKKLIMAIIFLTGFAAITCSVLYSLGIHDCLQLKHVGAIVIPFGLLVIALIFLTNRTKGLILLFLLSIIFSFLLAVLNLRQAMIFSSIASAVTAIALYAVIFARTRARKMLWFIASILLFTTGPLFKIVLGYSVIIHYLFIIAGLLILFLIFSK